LVWAILLLLSLATAVTLFIFSKYMDGKFLHLSVAIFISNFVIALIASRIFLILFRRWHRGAEQTHPLPTSPQSIRSEFITNMSHEIRTPLNGIIGITETLAESETDGDKLASLEAIKNSGDRLLYLVNEMLDFSKLEAGRMVLDPNVINISDLVHEAAATIELRCKKKGLNFSIDISSEVPATIHTDGHKLLRILLNLLGNAFKYTESGSIELSIKHNESNRRGDLLFKVTDSGRGIPHEREGHIFDSYTQVRDEDSGKGTGLGLAICKGLVELMGGEIWHESEAGKGSTFYFTIAAI